MLYVGVFLLGATMGTLFMAFMAGASRNNQCEDCRGEGPALPLVAVKPLVETRGI